MDITWKYKIPLSNPEVFTEIEAEYSITIPDTLKEFLAEANAATPSKIHFMVGATERILGAVLSYNKEDTDVDTVFTAFRSITDKSLIPFGIDPFGNYICISLPDQEVVFWDHESEKISTTEHNLDDFVAMLY